MSDEGFGIHFVALATDLNEAFREIAISPHPPTTLFHYTNEIAAESILLSRTFWATSALSQLDRHEISYGCVLLKDVLDRELNSRKLKPFVRAVLEELRMKPESRIEHIHLLCFCEQYDCLSLWRCYGSCCLHIKPVVKDRRGQVRPSLSTSMLGQFELFFVRVEYDQAVQRARLENAVDRVVNALNRGRYMWGEYREDVFLRSIVRNVAFTLSELFLTLICSLKDPRFVDEREWRLVVRPKQMPFSSASDDDDRRCRASTHEENGRRFVIVRGVHTGNTFSAIETPRLPLVGMSIAPCDEASDLKKNFEQVLAETGHAASVSISTIPTRVRHFRSQDYAVLGPQ